MDSIKKINTNMNQVYEFDYLFNPKEDSTDFILRLKIFLYESPLNQGIVPEKIQEFIELNHDKFSITLYDFVKSSYGNLELKNDGNELMEILSYILFHKYEIPTHNSMYSFYIKNRVMIGNKNWDKLNNMNNHNLRRSESFRRACLILSFISGLSFDYVVSQMKHISIRDTIRLVIIFMLANPELKTLLTDFIKNIDNWIGSEIRNLCKYFIWLTIKYPIEMAGMFLEYHKKYSMIQREIKSVKCIYDFIMIYDDGQEEKIFNAVSCFMSNINFRISCIQEYIWYRKIGCNDEVLQRCKFNLATNSVKNVEKLSKPIINGQMDKNLRLIKFFFDVIDGSTKIKRRIELVFGNVEDVEEFINKYRNILIDYFNLIKYGSRLEEAKLRLQEVIEKRPKSISLFYKERGLKQYDYIQDKRTLEFLNETTLLNSVNCFANTLKGKRNAILLNRTSNINAWCDKIVNYKKVNITDFYIGVGFKGDFLKIYTMVKKENMTDKTRTILNILFEQCRKKVSNATIYNEKILIGDHEVTHNEKETVVNYIKNELKAPMYNRLYRELLRRHVKNGTFV